jgi:polysaccharide deacetylase family protein (PEP-CTERM system associated)
MENIITFDLEDWHSLVHRRIKGYLPSPSNNIFRQTDRLLQILDEHKTTATFFVLGVVAEQHPLLVKQIISLGHEIASHGYAHVPITKLTPESFRADTERSKIILEDLTGMSIKGYRAAEFSIVRQTLWGLETLAELGFEYDSSIFPIHHRRYGIPDFPQVAKRYLIRNGLKIIEIPLSALSLGGIRIPFAGGGYFRLMPLKMISNMIKKLNNQNIPVVTYFHPYEFDPQRLNSFDQFETYSLKKTMQGLRYNFHQNIGRSTLSNKLKKLLTQYQFISCERYLLKGEIAEGEITLSNEK